jgi:hypothetical protein
VDRSLTTIPLRKSKGSHSHHENKIAFRISKVVAKIVELGLQERPFCLFEQGQLNVRVQRRALSHLFKCATQQSSDLRKD